MQVSTLPLFILPRFPLSLESRAELCRFVAMCIFTCTGQHASTHLGQVICVIASPGFWDEGDGEKHQVSGQSA
jgi:hypothetical protein